MVSVSAFALWFHRCYQTSKTSPCRALVSAAPWLVHAVLIQVSTVGIKPLRFAQDSAFMMDVTRPEDGNIPKRVE